MTEARVPETPASDEPAPPRGKVAAFLLWSGLGLVALAVLSLPVSTSAQGWFGLTTVAAMLAVRYAWPGRTGRLVFVALGGFMVLRYLVWRLSGTLPPLSEPVSFGFGFLLMAAELYCMVILFISLLVNIDPLTRKRPEASDDATLPTVDVFVPTYNEDADLLATTLAAARAMDYPAGKLTVWLLDDGGTDQKCNDKDPAKAAAAQARRRELQQLATDLGVRYATRARNEHAKAGNLNNGLSLSSGEIVVVFDADHAPFRSFLRETIGHFAADPRLFLVQTPHVFLNPDPIERNLRTFDRMPSENEMFYSVTQRGLDKWNGSFFCGSAALLRRAALNTVGGFSGITITEDCETAFELHARGWTSRYVDKPLIAGLQPETFDSFIGQRSRWCQGMFQILMLKNPALRPGLRMIQRLCYLSSMMFWFFPLPRLAFMLAPLLHIFFDLKIFVSSIDEALAFTGTYVVVNALMQNTLYGSVRWPWISELYEYVQGVYLAKAIGSVVLSPRKPTFNVTAKGQSLDADHLSPLATPFLVIFALLAAAVATAAWRYVFEPGVTSLMLVVGLWAAFNLVIAGAALGAVAERRQEERAPSLPIRRVGLLRIKGCEPLPVRIEQVSALDCVIVPGEGRSMPTGVEGQVAMLVVSPLPGATNPAARLAVTIGQPRAQGRHTLDIARGGVADAVGLAELMYADAEALSRFLQRRRVHKGVLAGSATMVRWAFSEPLRAFRLLARRTKAAAAAEPTPLELPATPVLAFGEPVPLPEAAPLSPAPAPAEAEASTLVGEDWLAQLADLARAERDRAAKPAPVPVRPAPGLRKAS
ncbi:MAG: UDP-forming cellulose synthase catalytic subunit [Alsobacter sp.]